jgi:hypothetical protein
MCDLGRDLGRGQPLECDKGIRGGSVARPSAEPDGLVGLPELLGIIIQSVDSASKQPGPDGGTLAAGDGDDRRRRREQPGFLVRFKLAESPVLGRRLFGRCTLKDVF